MLQYISSNNLYNPSEPATGRLDETDYSKSNIYYSQHLSKLHALNEKLSDNSSLRSGSAFSNTRLTHNKPKVPTLDLDRKVIENKINIYERDKTFKKNEEIQEYVRLHIQPGTILKRPQRRRDTDIENETMRNYKSRNSNFTKH
mgnify:CR=1 FL=1